MHVRVHVGEHRVRFYLSSDVGQLPSLQEQSHLSACVILHSFVDGNYYVPVRPCGYESLLEGEGEVR